VATPALASPKIGSFIPPNDFAKYAKQYAELGPRKLRDGAQQSLIPIIIAETTYGTALKMTPERSIADWAKKCYREERQMRDAMNDALERGLICSWPELPRDAAGKIDVSAKPKNLQLYLPSPEVWEKIPDLPRPERGGLRLVKKDEPGNRLPDTSSAKPSENTVYLPSKTLVTQELPEPTNKLGYQNETGLSDLGIAVEHHAASFVLRIFRRDEPGSRLPGPAIISRSESGNGLPVSGLNFDRKKLREDVDAKFRKMRRRPPLPDSAIWGAVCKRLDRDTPNQYLLFLIDAKISIDYNVQSTLLLKLAPQANEEWQRDYEAYTRQPAGVHNERPKTQFDQWLEANNFQPLTGGDLIELEKRFTGEKTLV